ncbi:MAG TPA: outer membrane beta-barrel family protein [Puia sp.]|uniref:outer membrane beta-barrel family protein n=1 Tax=Puia sp. TaxID=2045100 RepID=UPI002CEC86CE|nr:outer membrane beta-barrel family protein [Puia sp.]HVU94752.1 outer membrane beta-barrel family protein [Puia sp.]
MQQLIITITILLLALNCILQPITVHGQNANATDRGSHLSSEKKADSLKAITVNGRKPPVEVKADRTIVNVEGTINSVGQDALELLRKSPGVMVDKDNNISLSGKNGVKLYVDGRQVPLNGSDLADYLKTLQSSQIESIELISNPSAKYDASGNAGIINIRLKRNRSFGNNGSITGGYHVGAHSNYNGGLSLNHRDARFNWFGNYDYNNTVNTTNINLYRIQLDTLFDQHSAITPHLTSHTFKTGLDYYWDKYNTLGIMVDGSISNFSNPTNSNTRINYLPDGTTGQLQLNRILQADNNARGHRNNGNLDLNYHHTDSTGRDLSMDADYGIYRIRSDQYQPNIYLDPTQTTLLYSDIFDIVAPTNIDIYTFKTDYEQPFRKGRLGLGVKTSYVTSGNDFRQYDVVSNAKRPDTLNSSNFNYKENVNAVYADYSRPFKGWALQAGLRVENTNAKGTSNGYHEGPDRYQPFDSTFDRHYTGFFPSGSVTYNMTKTQMFTLTYSRRIDRPAYQDLNPFEFKLDEYTYMKGNTGLRPQYTNSFGLTHVYKGKLVTTLNYSHVNDVFTQLVDTTGRSKAFLTKKNLATQDITSLNISYPWSIGRYSLFANVNTYYSKYNANFGAGRTVDLDVFAVNVFAQQSFRLGKDYSADLSGFYSSPSIWQGTFKTHAIGNLDAGVQKAIWNKKGLIKLSVSDVFRTLHFTATSDFAGQYLRATGHNESRQLKLYFTYKFGNSQVKAARTRKSAAEEESKRSNSQGGIISN